MVLPVTKASNISTEKEKARWLVEELWLDEAVGFIGGEPKTCKTTMSAELAVSVSSGSPCLRRFPVKRKGKVLMYAAEDSLHVIKRRLEAVAQASDILLIDCDIHLITVPVLRLDIKEHREDLTETIAEMKPTLLILDPFIRLHTKDENLSGEVAPLLAYLRALQKIHSTAIAVVHHARKRAGRARAGQSLRGSSELHAWYDSHLYMTRREGQKLSLDVEHRSESSREGICLEIVQTADALSLEVDDSNVHSEDTASVGRTIEEKVFYALRNSNAPLSLNAIRTACRIRKSSVSQALSGLLASGFVRKVSTGYEMAR